MTLGTRIRRLVRAGLAGYGRLETDGGKDRLQGRCSRLSRLRSPSHTGKSPSKRTEPPSARCGEVGAGSDGILTLAACLINIPADIYTRLSQSAMMAACTEVPPYTSVKLRKNDFRPRHTSAGVFVCWHKRKTHQSRPGGLSLPAPATGRKTALGIPKQKIF
jgi:hypothetical protein